MKKFFVTVILGYTAIALLIFITTQLRGDRRRGVSSGQPEITAKNASSREGKPADNGTGVQKLKGALSADISPSKVDKEKSMRHFKTYFKNGRVSSEWLFKNGRLDGDITFFHSNGQKWMELPIKDDAVDGVMKEFYENGKLLRTSQFSQGVLDGTTTFYYGSAGQAWTVMIFERGVLKELPKFFSENGTGGDMLERVGLSAPAGEGSQGVFRVLSETGDVKAEWSHDGSASGGAAKAYYDSGAVSVLWTVKDDKVDGSLMFYRPDGSVLFEWSWAQNAPAGTLHEYDEKRQLRREVTFSAGVLNGLSRIFYDDVSRFCEMVYENGKLSHLPQAYSQGQSQSKIPSA